MAYRHNVDLAVIDVPEEAAVDTYKQRDANELVIVLVRARHLGKRGTPPDQGPLSRVRITSGSWASSDSTEKRGISPLWLETFRIECEDLCGNQPVNRVHSLSHFSAMTRPCWLRRAARNRHRHAIEQAPRRWRGGRRDDSARTRRKILISTQAPTWSFQRGGLLIV